MCELRFPCRRLGSISPWDQEREREETVFGAGGKRRREEELSQRVYSNTFFPFLSALHFPFFLRNKNHFFRALSARSIYGEGKLSEERYLLKAGGRRRRREDKYFAKKAAAALAHKAPSHSRVIFFRRKKSTSLIGFP